MSKYNLNKYMYKISIQCIDTIKFSFKIENNKIENKYICMISA